MFTSTRLSINATASKAILEGLAPKGGLYVKEKINASFFNEALLDLDYKTLTHKVFNEFLDDYDQETISTIISQCYDDQFKPDMVSLKHLLNVSFLNLFHGQTFSFKDMALSILPSLFDHAKQIQNVDKKTIILTATSGDTGSAALSGFSQLKDTFVIVLYPLNGVSKFQELQMNQFKSDHCLLYGIEGDFDDCQNIVKELFQTVELKHSIISSANSINIGRIIPQIVYYFHSYLTLVKDNKIKFNEKINLTVPTGNFGNIYAGYLAKHMGLPVHKLIIASNSNHVLTDLFQTQTYSINRHLKKTVSPSMDIIISSNFERYLYDLVESPKNVEDYMNQLKMNQEIHITELNEETTFHAFYASESDTLKTIKDVYDQYGYLIDPHTAVGYHCYQQYQEQSKDNHYHVVLSTASPFKFSDAMIQALGLESKLTLAENIDQLKQLAPNQFDTRVMDVVDGTIDAKTLSKTEALHVLKKVIGEIDAKN